jgi:SAM-dependent methyltransferase
LAWRAKGWYFGRQLEAGNDAVTLAAGAPSKGAEDMAGHRYGDDFMRYTAESSVHSASVVARLIAGSVRISSVLDVGCATGTWLAAWQESGVGDCFGIDGDYVDPALLRVPRDLFGPCDLSKPFDLGRDFDLVQSLEVAEHIPEEGAAAFIGSITRHARRYVLFSAAPPGQGGEFHVNEQPYEYWKALFERRGFVAHDAVRPAIAGDPRVSYWYRYNTLLYVREDATQELPEAIARSRVPVGAPVPDLSPALFRARKAIVRMLPPSLQDAIARAKARLLPSGRI